MPGTVTIASKLPHGLHLRVFKMGVAAEPTPTDDKRMVPKAYEDGSRVTIKGAARIEGQPFLAGGYALTHDVPSDFWEQWLAANRESEIVKKGLIFAHAKSNEASAMAKDHSDLRSGFEPINPTALPTEFRGKIETAPLEK